MNNHTLSLSYSVHEDKCFGFSCKTSFLYLIDHGRYGCSSPATKVLQVPNTLVNCCFRNPSNLRRHRQATVQRWSPMLNDKITDQTLEQLPTPQIKIRNKSEDDFPMRLIPTSGSLSELCWCDTLFHRHLTFIRPQISNFELLTVHQDTYHQLVRYYCCKTKTLDVLC